MNYLSRYEMLPQSWWGNAAGNLPRDLFGVLNELADPGRSTWYELPRMVIAENADGIEVKAALPGFDPASVDAEVLGDFLTIRGEKKAAALGENERFIHRERGADHLEETIKLPCRVTASGIKAKFADGMLVISLPREVPEQPKNIKVSIER